MKYRADTNNEPTKEVRQWNGIPLNITTRTGESRFSFSPPMTCDYGCIRGSWGAGLDGKALDVYVISDAPTVFRVVQITPTGAIDEYKYVLGAQNFDEAVETFLKHVPRQLFGAASQYSIGQLQDDIAQQSKVRKDVNELTNFVEQLEELIESDDAYSSNIYVLSFEVADNGDISGKFEDAWNGRIFSYSVQKNRIGYKPALTLDRADSLAAAKLFDIFSSGYTSMQVRRDAVKSGKKPRCTAVSYSCGRACIQLKNTCWINSSGQRVKKAGGAVASISQGRIDKLRTLAKYLAANGNNKWSKYGSAELLATKASNLERARSKQFASSVAQPVVKAKLPTIDNTHDVIPSSTLPGADEDNSLATFVSGLTVHNPEVVDKIAKITGMKDKEVKLSLEALKKFSGTEEYKKYRELEKTGKIISENSSEAIAKTRSEVKAINQYIDKMPKFHGSIYRGMRLESQQVLDDVIKKLQNGESFELNAMSSFSSSEFVARTFALTDRKDQSVALIYEVVENKSGVTIRNLSRFPGEDEVLAPKGARYELAGDTKFFHTPGGTIITIPVKEV